MGVESEEGEEDEQKLPIIAPYIYDARYHANPYILSTTVLSDGTKWGEGLGPRYLSIGLKGLGPRYLSIGLGGARA